MVELPAVDNIIVDEKRKITYNIKAYRKLSRDEMVVAVRFFMQQKNAKKMMKPGSTIEIISTLH